MELPSHRRHINLHNLGRVLATAHKVEVNCDVSASDAGSLNDGESVHKKFTPQLYEQLRNFVYTNYHDKHLFN